MGFFRLGSRTGEREPWRSAKVVGKRKKQPTEVGLQQCRCSLEKSRRGDCVASSSSRRAVSSESAGRESRSSCCKVRESSESSRNRLNRRQRTASNRRRITSDGWESFGSWVKILGRARPWPLSWSRMRRSATQRWPDLLGGARTELDELLFDRTGSLGDPPGKREG